MSVLGERLRTLREGKGLSQIDVGRLLGMTSATISAYELGKREPDPSTLKKLADVYSVSVDYLLGRIMAGERREEYRVGEPRVPDWVRNLPPHLQTKLSDQDWSRTFFRMMDTAALNNLSPEVLEAVIETLVEAKKRDEAAKAKLTKDWK